MKKIVMLLILISLFSCGKDSEYSYSSKECTNKAKDLLDESLTEGVSKYYETIKTTKTFDTIFSVPLSGGSTTYSDEVISACYQSGCLEGYKKIYVKPLHSVLNFICVKEETCVDKTLKKSYTIPDEELLKELMMDDLIDTVSSTKDECVTNPPAEGMGCMDSRASNYNPEATQSDGSCECDGEAIYSEEFGCST